MKKIKAFILRHFEGSLIVLILGGILAIAFLVHYYKFSFLNFFFLPVILAGYYLGKKKAVLTAVLCVLLVFLYLIFTNLFNDPGAGLDFDEVVHVLTWGCFLILTGGIVGTVSEQRESKIKNMRRAYIGVLEILLKYLEVADEEKPRSLRASFLAGKVAGIMDLGRREVENIKSAALLYDAGHLPSSLSLFDQVAGFVEEDLKVTKSGLRDRELVMVKTTASLLKEVEPILTGYYRHYVREADRPDKNVAGIPTGSSIIALTDSYIKKFPQAPVPHEEKLKFLAEVEKLKGRSYSEAVVRAFRDVLTS